MSEKLLPCPFCGDAPLLQCVQYARPIAECRNRDCPMFCQCAYVDKWNTRAVSAEIAAIRNVIEPAFDPAMSLAQHVGLIYRERNDLRECYVAACAMEKLALNLADKMREELDVARAASPVAVTDDAVSAGISAVLANFHTMASSESGFGVRIEPVRAALTAALSPPPKG